MRLQMESPTHHSLAATAIATGRKRLAAASGLEAESKVVSKIAIRNSANDTAPKGNIPL